MYKTWKGENWCWKPQKVGCCQILFGYYEILEYIVIFQTAIIAVPAARAAVSWGVTKAVLMFLLVNLKQSLWGSSSKNCFNNFWLLSWKEKQCFGGLCSWEVLILATWVLAPFCGSEEPSGLVLTCTLKVLTSETVILPCPKRVGTVPHTTE